ncbi:uncharacterized protein LOC111614115 [Centruroides sculpturatus]|uniref:uncharacterized protein LOC111614115 n=1 Tax=Centruroides sculpturatus TaxID=218467 RepID=UPI000C6DB4E8|nr:uncharacterized protein LOC111614115 [Centruroides sculpturatus]
MNEIINMVKNEKIRKEIEDLVKNIVTDLIFLEDNTFELSAKEYCSKIINGALLSPDVQTVVVEPSLPTTAPVASHFSEEKILPVKTENEPSHRNISPDNPVNVVECGIKNQSPTNYGLFVEYPSENIMKTGSIVQDEEKTDSTNVVTHQFTSEPNVDKTLEVEARKRPTKINTKLKKDPCNIVECETKFNKHLEEFVIDGEVKAEFENETTLTRKKRIKINPDILAKIETAKRRKVLEKLLARPSEKIKSLRGEIADYQPEKEKLLPPESKIIQEKSQINIFQHPICQCTSNCNCEESCKYDTS